MNPSLYQQLLDDAQKDLNAFDENLSELRMIESYAERKLNGGGDSKFRELLDEVRRDISGAERDATELRNVAEFARRKLGGGGRQEPSDLDKRPRGGADDEARKPPPPRPVAPQAARPGAAPTPAPKPAPPPTKPVPRPPTAEEPDTMQTIEFGPDGFPMR